MASSTEPLAGLQAIVTGGTRGIGAAVVERLRAAGCTVVPVARSADREGFAGDVTRKDDVDRLAATYEPDILINAAGAFGLAAVA